MARSRDWQQLSMDELDQISREMMRHAVEFLVKHHAVLEAGLAERLRDGSILKKAEIAFETVVHTYVSAHYFDVRNDDKAMAAEARNTAAKLRKVIALMRSIPQRQAGRYLRHKKLPTFLFASHFYDVFEHAVERFDEWSKAPSGRPPRWEVDLAAENTVVAIQLLTGRDFKKDLQTADNEFVNLDAILAQQTLAILDPKVTRENVKSALLNVLSRRD